MKRTTGSLAIALTFVSGAALAQVQRPSALPPEPAQVDVARGESVLTRARPDYDPAGIRLGGFILYPELGLQEQYESNIFATSSGTESDFVTMVEPRLDLRSNWNNHALNLFADALVARYADNSRENYENYSFGSNGRLDIQRDARLFAGASYGVRHEPRYSPNDLGGQEPTEYDILSGNLAGEKEFNRLGIRLDGTVDRFSYDDNRNAAGVPLLESQRDRTEYVVGLRPSYEIAPLRQVYAAATFNVRDYDSATTFGVDRDSHGYAAVVGARYDITGIVFADAFVGYRRQEYSAASLASASGPTAGATLTWNVTRLTTITGSLSREIEETILAGSSSYFATRAELRADHELLRNFIISANAGYQNDAFEGIARDDDTITAGLSGKYLINRNFALSGGYSLRSRSSDAAGADFDNHIGFIRLSSHL